MGGALCPFANNPNIGGKNGRCQPAASSDYAKQLQNIQNRRKLCPKLFRTYIRKHNEELNPCICLPTNFGSTIKTTMPGPPKGNLQRGGRKRGSRNKKGRKVRSYLPKEFADIIAKTDRSGRSMAEIQLDCARWCEQVALDEIARGKDADIERARRYRLDAAKVAHDVSPYLYATHQSIRHAGDENAPPIRLENLSDYQLELLIQRLERG